MITELMIGYELYDRARNGKIISLSFSLWNLPSLSPEFYVSFRIVASMHNHHARNAPILNLLNNFLNSFFIRSFGSDEPDIVGFIGRIQQGSNDIRVGVAHIVMIGDKTLQIMFTIIAGDSMITVSKIMILFERIFWVSKSQFSIRIKRGTFIRILHRCRWFFENKNYTLGLPSILNKTLGNCNRFQNHEMTGLQSEGR